MRKRCCLALHIKRGISRHSDRKPGLLPSPSSKHRPTSIPRIHEICRPKSHVSISSQVASGGYCHEPAAGRGSPGLTACSAVVEVVGEWRREDQRWQYRDTNKADPGMQTSLACCGVHLSLPRVVFNNALPRPHTYPIVRSC